LPPGSSNVPGGYRKPRADLYTVLLIVALLALVIGTIFLYLETAQYEGNPPYKGVPSVWIAPEAPVGPSPVATRLLASSWEAVQGGCRTAV
jgi:hypothetical protein